MTSIFKRTVPGQRIGQGHVLRGLSDEVLEHLEAGRRGEGVDAP